jgi:hypothetical protein
VPASFFVFQKSLNIRVSESKTKKKHGNHTKAAQAGLDNAFSIWHATVPKNREGYHTRRYHEISADRRSGFCAYPSMLFGEMSYSTDHRRQCAS